MGTWAPGTFCGALSTTVQHTNVPNLSFFLIENKHGFIHLMPRDFVTSCIISEGFRSEGGFRASSGRGWRGKHGRLWWLLYNICPDILLVMPVHYIKFGKMLKEGKQASHHTSTASPRPRLSESVWSQRCISGGPGIRVRAKGSLHTIPLPNILFSRK